MRIPLFSSMLSNAMMKTIDQIHRERLIMLRDECGGVGKLAARIEKQDSQVSQWINASINSGTGKSRGVSSDICRYIEEKFSKPIGWMDSDPSKTDATALMQLFALYMSATEEGQHQIMIAATQADKALNVKLMLAYNN